jgi:hypothetical protein
MKYLPAVILGFFFLISACKSSDDSSSPDSSGFIVDISAIWTDSIDQTHTVNPNLSGNQAKFKIIYTVKIDNATSRTYNGILLDTAAAHMKMVVLSAVDTVILKKP